MVLLFDLDNTLVDRRGAFGRWADAWRKEKRLDVDATAWLVEADRGGYRPRTELFAEAVNRFQLDAEPDDLVAEYRRMLPRYVTPDPTLNRGLKELRDKGWKIGVVTNGSSAQHAKLASAHLTDLVDAMTVSEEIGVRKPQPQIFRATAEAAGTTLEQGWMVGDNPEADIRGGTEVGLSTIWLSHGADWPLPHLQPTLTVETIRDALRYLLTCPAP